MSASTSLSQSARETNPPYGEKTAIEPQRFIFYSANWDFYNSMWNLLDGRRLRLTYDRGTLEIMSPAPMHENYSRIIDRLVHEYTLAANLEIYSLGSTTWRRKILERGLEPDSCYYTTHQPQMWNKTDIDLDKDPPPDLCIEIDITSSSLNRMGIYAALGVPEVWRHDGESLTFLHLENGAYVRKPISLSFPKLPLAELNRFIHLRQTTMENVLIRQFQAAAKAWL